VEAGLLGEAAPGGERFGPIWDQWNGRPPAQQVADSVRANEEFVSRIEALSDAQRAEFTVAMFGSDVDLAGLVGMRFGEYAVHTWDIAVALEPTAEVASDAVELLIDRLAALAARAGKPAEVGRTVVIETVAPSRRFALTTGPDVVLTPDSGTEPADLRLPAESFLRLVYGRLDPDHTPAELADNAELASLRQLFTGF
ncbi:MAG TPA: maleylpyruvate isomerase family mycothiol-dependent enzyme, partial [Pseudonocardiaceae bacterium]